jgi:hypothetical protein
VTDVLLAILAVATFTIIGPLTFLLTASACGWLAT